MYMTHKNAHQMGHNFLAEYLDFAKAKAPRQLNAAKAQLEYMLVGTTPLTAIKTVRFKR